ncbi:hypothetical protein BXZ70DRAFT_1009847 [Cristinia sonorae]|uniref:Uncharacterized protein n=1 Tax=Cristinia sonorae TaxID=1940300 RepID=A0A8K0XN85_9AGAR|nr:hypothetical protein BXZ70DRAFT_1009847 [Cristinia sonorae]
MDVDSDPSSAEWEVPKVESEDDFELCRALKEKGRPTGKFERLLGSATVKASVVNWEPLFIQFKDNERGELA